MKIIIVLLLFPFALFGQQLVGSAGGTLQGSMQLSFSVGEIAVSSYRTDEMILHEGVQQSFDFSTTSIDVALLETTIFPNPTSHYLSVEIDDFAEVQRVEVVDHNGIKVHSDHWQGSAMQQLNISSLHPGMYRLLVIRKDSKLGFIAPFIKSN